LIEIKAGGARRIENQFYEFCSICREFEMRDSKRGAAAAPLPPGAAQNPMGSPAKRRRDGAHTEWFETFAVETVMPMLERATHDLRRRGYGTSARLDRASGRLVAELEVMPPHLPAGARPPRLAITASRSPREQNPSPDRPLLVEFTGTFPHAGATGEFGAEIDYTTIYPANLEEKVAEFMEMATA
jgi:hypothetical protein